MSASIKYRIVKTKRQYDEYCKKLRSLLEQNNDKNEDEIELLTLLIENWDSTQYQEPDLDPVQIIKALMDEHQLKAKDLTEILNLSKGTVSKILSYQKGLSKDTIRRLANHFKLTQESFNRPYKLRDTVNRKFKTEALMNTRKEILKTK
ncbi:MAG: helix-turn-helix domain-containing protein [Saprospiraceae bacterium]|nr:helix-turn-helix domain-containing protein [Saprospiraceae bacterium]